MKLFIDNGDSKNAVGLSLVPSLGTPGGFSIVVTKNGVYYDSLLRINGNGIHRYSSPKLATLGFKLNKDDKVCLIDCWDNIIEEN